MCAQADAASKVERILSLPHSSFFPPLAGQVNIWEADRLQVARHFGA